MPRQHPLRIRPARFFSPARLLPVLCLALAPLLFCLTGAARATDAPLPVIVSIPPQKYMLERIAGERAAVSVLVSPGADPHSYEPSPTQMRACSSAAVWFTIGLPFEDAWLPRIRGAAPNLAAVSSIARIKRLSFADDALLLADLELSGRKTKTSGPGPASTRPPDSTQAPGAGAADHGDQDGNDSRPAPHDHDRGADPHVWLSPMLVRAMLPGMAAELGKRLPRHAAEFRDNAAAFAAELEELDRLLAERFSVFPREKRVFLTFHPSWRYFAHNYGLTELAVETDGKEPGPQGMKAIINAAKKYAIRTLFVEPRLPRAPARAVAAAINAKMIDVDPLTEDLMFLYHDLADKLTESFTR